jgi:hypothetical protein
MAITSTYPIITPKLGDLIVGTQTYTAADPVLDNPTRNFTVQSVINLVQAPGGVINLVSPNGTSYNVSVSNAGALVVTAV